MSAVTPLSYIHIERARCTIANVRENRGTFQKKTEERGKRKIE